MHLDLRMPMSGTRHILQRGLRRCRSHPAGSALRHRRAQSHIAWGFTNLGPNVEDLYVEKFNDKGEYLTPQGWKQPEHRKEIIRVKGKPEVNLDVVITRHGPIISDLVPGENASSR